MPESPGVSLPGDSVSSRDMQWINTCVSSTIVNNNNEQQVDGEHVAGAAKPAKRATPLRAALRRQALSTFLLTSKMCLPPGCGPGFSPSLAQERVPRHTVEHIVDLKELTGGFVHQNARTVCLTIVGMAAPVLESVMVGQTGTIKRACAHACRVLAGGSQPVLVD